MDNRSYPRDRPLIHNPNHQTAPPPPQHPPYPSYSSSAASSQAPPVHVPFGDPYVQRDPFLPASQHQRRGSYGIHSGPGPAGSPSTGAVSGVQADRPPLGGGSWPNTASQHSLSHGHHAQQSSLPPPPPPQLSTSLPPATTASYSSTAEPGRRGSIGSGSPPTYYQTTRDPLPPPPSIGNRQMLPPSPQQQNASNSHSSQRPFSGSRELPGLGSSHRQGSGMSISSLLGRDAPSAAPSQNSPPTASSASPPSKSMQPPSPRRTHSGSSRNEYSLYRRPHTPDKFQVNPTARTSDPHSYMTASPIKHGSGASDQDQRRQPGSQNTSPWRGMGTQESKFYPPTSVGREKEGVSTSSGPMPPRPNSQPAGQPGPSPESERKPFGSDYRRPPYTYSPEERHRTYSDHGPPRSAPEAGERPPLAGSDQGRAVTAQPSTHSQFSPPRESTVSGSHHGQHPQSQPQSLFWRHQVGDETRRQPGPPSREDSSIGRSPYSASSTSAPSGRSSASLGADSAPLPPRTLEYSNPRSVGHYQPPPTSDPSSTERRRENITSVPNQTGRASPYDGHTQRSFLLGPDANRRTGRASPLPQAVQGASLQPVGPAGNPNIKSEFGRMFSGLGGGISSVPSRTGASTPSRQSPLPHGPGESHPGGGGHLQDLEMVRSASQSGRRAKRTKDDDGIPDSDSVDGRVTPSLAAARGQKRSKHAHPASHHHHHHTHQYGALSQSQGESRANMAASHHHHHHKPDDEAPPPGAGPFGGPRFNGTSAPSAPGTQAAHHHHHHHASHPPHHHHHAPRPGTVPPAPIPAPPKVIVNVQSVLDGVAHLPRHHLGSQLYEAQAVLPPSTVPLDDKFMTNSYPKPIPSFTPDRANSTFTVRIPRYYLKTRQRELLCKRPYIWGARIYRDDSDPLAAAIHSGWVRGAWDKDEVDVAMLDPRLQPPPASSTDAANSSSTANATSTTAAAAAAPPLPELDELVTTLPPTPVDPPADCDLHLTLLLLPPLDKYHSTVEYGVRSRKAGGGYHGMSFMVLSMRWVDEGMGSRGQERGAEARSKRLSAAAALLKLMMGGMEGAGANGEVEGGVKGIGGQAVVRKAVVGA